jgi:cytochrome c biogenesis protein CcmG/thiol:disulfide interchange protein DsbE
MITASTSRRAFAGIALTISALLAGCSPSPIRAAEVSNRTRKAAPDFTLTDVSGRPVKLSEYKGKVVLLNFWATWCGPCKTEIPWFIEFEKMYKDRGFEILGVSMDENGWQAVREPNGGPIPDYDRQ